MISLISDEIYELIQTAKRYESVGKYNEAAEILSKYWNNTNERPNVWGLNEAEQAEMLLRCGSLAGYIGSCGQKKKAQELAQDLLGEAINLFSILGDAEKLAECATYFALSFWRLGQLEEAKCWIDRSFEYEIEEHCEIRLYSYLIEGLILLEAQKYIELVNKCKKLEPLFKLGSFYVLQGDFNNNYAFGLMKLGEKEQAIKRYNLAKHYYSLTNHYLYLAGVENNLAVFYLGEGYFAEAHKSAKSAIENFKLLGDKTREGYAFDTQAQIYFAEGKYEEALKCANEAVKMLQNGENYCYLANSMQTKSHIQFYLKDFDNSMKTMVASSNVASLHISPDDGNKFIEEYAALLTKLLKQ